MALLWHCRGQVRQPAISTHINEVHRHLICRCCERDNSFNSWPIATKLHIWPCCDIVSVKFDSRQFPRILMRCAGIWLVDVVNAITALILYRFRCKFIYGLVVTLSPSSSTDSNFAHINEVSRHLIGWCCECDNYLICIMTKLQIWHCCDIVLVKFDSLQFPRKLMRWAAHINEVSRSY
jgi:hypothetical protein